MAVGTLAIAPAANAVSAPLDACNKFNIVVASGLPVTVHYPSGCDYDGYNVVGTVDYSVVDDSVNRNVTVTVWNTGTGYVWLSFNGGAFDGPDIVPCGAYPLGAEPGSWQHYYIDCGPSIGTPPPSWYQSVGRASASATCPDGWTQSWAQWMNGGTGGYTCDREQYWSTSANDWAFRMLPNRGK